MRVFGRDALKWNRDELKLGRQKMASLQADRHHPGMWRVEFDGTLSDMVNRTRAKDAAMALVLSKLNTEETRGEAPPVR